MREHIIRAWCDRCEYLGQPRAEARHTYTVGVVEGETRPALKIIELCDECDATELDMLGKLLVNHAIPLDPKAIKPSVVAAPATVAFGATDTIVECLVCHVTMNKGSLIGHIWSQHRPTETRPSQPTRCPDCKQTFTNGMAMHRNRMHGYSALDDAYAGLL